VASCAIARVSVTTASSVGYDVSVRCRLVACLGLLAACGLDVVGVNVGVSTSPLDGGESDAEKSGEDSGAPIPPAPRPAVCAATEDCTDGLDNDCNGTADCADPACIAEGFACVPAVPTGFRIVAFDATTRAACPTGFDSSSDVVVDPNTAPAACGCTCDVGAQPSCVSGSIPASFGSTSSCASGSGTYTNVDGACASVNYTILANVKTTRLAPTGGTCVVHPTKNVDPSSGQGRTCALAGPVGAGCAGGGVCTRAPAAPFKACVSQAGDVACPGAYTAKHTVGASVADTRDCSTCTCGPTPVTTCTNTVWNQYTSSDCSGTPVGLVADGNCDPSNAGGATYRSSKYVATVVASCAAPTPPTPTGIATIVGQGTVCCTP
jgi:hypothetical protein